jgi:hypothetical protein
MTPSQQFSMGCSQEEYKLRITVFRISDSFADNLCGETVMRYVRSDHCTPQGNGGNGIPVCEMWQCIYLVPVYALNYAYVFKAT